MIGLSAYFSAAEIGLMSLNRYRLRHLMKKKHKTALRVGRMLERPDRLLGVILIGNTCANIYASAVVTKLSERFWGDWGLVFGPIALTLVLLIFGEIGPKTVAALYPQKVAFTVSRSLNFIQKILYPLVWMANGVTNAILKLIGVKMHNHKVDSLSHDELRTVVHEAGSLISDEHKTMLISILDLETVTVDDIMVPRNEIVGIDLNEKLEEIIERLESSQHTRLPLYQDSIDHVLGMVHLRSVMNLMAEDNLTKEQIQAVAEEVYYVPVGIPLHRQLLSFRAAKTRTGIVVDEYGDILGLVTMEDILEEIVGEFTTDVAAFGKDVHPQEDGSVMVDGGAMIRELNRSMHWKLPSRGPKTLSGLIIEYAQFIPPVGTSVKIAGHPIEVIQTKDNKIKTVRVYPKIKGE